MDPESSVRNAGIQDVAKGAGAAHLFRIHLHHRTFVLVLEMQPFRWNLAQVNFHPCILSFFMILI